MMEAIKQKLRRFAKDRDWDQFHSPKNLAIAISVEAAEIVEHFQWVTEEDSFKMPSDKLKKIKEEIGDVMICLVMLSDKLGIDPLTAANNKILINEKKYPVDKSKGNIRKYNEI